MCVCVYVCVLCVFVCFGGVGSNFSCMFFCQGSTFVSLPRSYEKSVDNIGVKRCLV